MYLSANTRPDIAYTVHQAARFSHAPRHSHAIAVRRFLRYLQKTKTMGLLLKPTNTQRVDCYVDADFAGLLLLKIIKIPFQSSPVLAMLCCTKAALSSGYPRCRLRLPWVPWRLNTWLFLRRCVTSFQFVKYSKNLWPLYSKFNQVLHIMRIPTMGKATTVSNDIRNKIQAEAKLAPLVELILSSQKWREDYR